MRPSLALALPVCFFVSFASLAHGAELPSGYAPVSGTSSYTTSADGNSGTLTATSDVTIGQWAGGFDVGEGKTFTANLPAGGRHLSRDITADPSVIFGTLNVPNGRFFLVNTNGVVFTPNSQVNAAGLVASTLDILNADFMAGNYKFTKASGKAPATVSNAGTLAGGAGGVALIGGSVHHQGMITTTTGSVVLASGEAVTLQLDPLGHISALVDTPAASAPSGATDAVRQTGGIRAGRNVLITAEALNGVFDNLVNMTGLSTTNAGLAVSEGGTIWLRATSGRANLGGALNPGTGGIVGADARVVDLNQSLEGPFLFDVFADEANLNSSIGLVSPLRAVNVTARTIEVPRAITTGSQVYQNRPYYDGSADGFLLELNGNLSASGLFGSLHIDGTTRLNNDVTLRTEGANSLIQITGTVNGLNWGEENLGIEAANDVTIDAGIGHNFATGQGTRIGRLSLRGTPGDVTFGSYVTSFSLYQAGAKAGSTTRFNGPVNSWNYADLNGGNFTFSAPVRTSNGGAFTMTNSGAFTTSAAADFTLDGAFLQDGAGPSRIAGDIRTTNDSVTFLRPVTLTGDLLLDTGNGAGNITFGDTLYGTTSGLEDLKLHAGTGNITFGGQVGYDPDTGAGVRVGRLNIQNAFDVTASGLFTAATVFQAEGTGTTRLNGFLRTNQWPGITLNGNNFVLNGATATGGQIVIRHRGSVTLQGSYSPSPTLQERA